MASLVTHGIGPTAIDGDFDLEGAIIHAYRLIDEGKLDVAIQDGLGNSIRGDELAACYRGGKTMTTDLRAVPNQDTTVASDLNRTRQRAVTGREWSNGHHPTVEKSMTMGALVKLWRTLAASITQPPSPSSHAWQLQHPAQRRQVLSPRLVATQLPEVDAHRAHAHLLCNGCDRQPTLVGPDRGCSACLIQRRPKSMASQPGCSNIRYLRRNA